MISAARLKKCLRYNKRTGTFTWITSSAVRAAGSIAGSLHSSGYIHIKIKNRSYKAHRLAWLYVTGKWPREDVEHRNRCKNDNRWRNLRLTNDSLNQANTSLRVDNTSGGKGIHVRENGKYRVRIQVRTKRISLGDFTSLDAATTAYIVAAKKHFGEFARVQ